MQILFLHNNFPGQFRHIALDLATRPQHQVMAVGSHTAQEIRGVPLRRYSQPEATASMAHPFAKRFDLECRRAEQVFYAAIALRERGFHPHIVVAHTGWGEALPLRELFPRARIICYAEFHYQTEGLDVGFDPEFPDNGLDALLTLKLRNASTVLSLLDCDSAITPSAWQRSTFPVELQSKLTVLHDGIRTDLACPDPNAEVVLSTGRRLTRSDEVVTFVSRDLEPIRGFHIMLRAIPLILKRRPNAQILIVGGDGISYGAQPPAGTTWREHLFEPMAGTIDTSRVHFMGRLTYLRYINVLRVSSAHIYLTYPFVLSWSMLEAMSAGCALIASDTGPVQEVVDNRNGIRVPFFDHEAIAHHACRALRSPEAYHTMREHARATVVSRYSTTQTLPAWTQFLTS
jgi:glycosyltransferase involved in cell wall biosynthesis